MEHKHTPGPWTNHGRTPQPGLNYSCIAARTLIARVFSEQLGDEEQETANARLIAAAPDLLEALIEVVRISDRKHDAWDAAKTAIAKATGT